jgi:hypothetical protein
MIRCMGVLEAVILGLGVAVLAILYVLFWIDSNLLEWVRRRPKDGEQDPQEGPGDASR